MIKQTGMNDLIRELSHLLPEDLQQARDELDKNVKASLYAALSRLDLVTREEFEVQRELLIRTRTRLEALQARVEMLEQEHSGQG